MSSTLMLVFHTSQLAAYVFTLYYAFLLLTFPNIKRPGATGSFDPGQMKYLTIWDVVSVFSTFQQFPWNYSH